MLKEKNLIYGKYKKSKWTVNHLLLILFSNVIINYWSSKGLSLYPAVKITVKKATITPIIRASFIYVSSLQDIYKLQAYDSIIAYPIYSVNVKIRKLIEDYNFSLFFGCK